MAPGTFDKATVSLISERLILSQDVDMPIFHIESLAVVNKTFRGGRRGISAKMVLKRKITSEMMTTFLPSVLLMMITFATTFFKPFFFEAALSVNLTTMLVMTTIFISKMESLPSTSDIKMIDIWLVLCQMVPFAEVVLLTAMEYNRVDSLDGSDRGIFVATYLEMDETNKEDQTCIPYVPTSWLPQLKIIGECFESLQKIKSFFILHELSERKVLPSAVLGSFYFYFGTAALFYYGCV